MGCLSSTICYGETGGGKTGAVGSFAKWVKLRTGKMLRLYTAEPDIGTIEHLVGECIEVVNIQDRPNACETIAMASQGWAPPVGRMVTLPEKVSGLHQRLILGITLERVLMKEGQNSVTQYFQSFAY